MEKDRDENYYAMLRREIIALLPSPAGRVLDVGCGAGVTSDYLRKHSGATSLVGCDISLPAIEAAALVLDETHVIDLNRDSLLSLKGEEIEARGFDTILCLDILEHLMDPWTLLAEITPLLAANGRVIASIPNVRHFGTLLPLLFSGRFNYEPSGTRDIDHLRFFTESSMRNLFHSSGYEILTFLGSQGKKTRFLEYVTCAALNGFLDYQYFIAATPQKAALR